MSEYTWILEDIMSGVITAGDVTDIAPGATAEVLLNRAGSIKASLPLDSTFATAELIDPGRTALYLARNGRIEQGGPIWMATPSSSTGRVDLVVEGWLGYWDHRDVERDRQFLGEEQFEIVATLIADAQDEGVWGTGYDLGITVDWVAPSGVLRDRMEDYRPWRRAKIGNAIRQLAATIGGFDMAMTYDIVGDRITKSLRLYHPQKGRVTGHVFEYDRAGDTNVLEYSAPKSARAMAWAGTGWGDGTDALRLRSTRYVDETKRGIYPPLTAAHDFSGVVIQTTLDENTAATFERTRNARRVPSLTVNPNASPPWGHYELGDTIGVVIDDGYVQVGTDSYGPQQCRIFGTTIDVDADTMDHSFQEDAGA